ncbi:MAG: hydantoinase/oxoprolinase family protein [Chloroflexi bacterium]|nr:hydantoinase/oxoprolinase family protein [Chloroflexota bacterium]
MSYIIGIDSGGTFTDCVLVDDQGRIASDKAFTTPQNLTEGILQSIENTAKARGLGLQQVLKEADLLAVGTTSLLNALLTRRGAKVGLITTRGHEDALVIGRVMAKTDGLSEAEKRDIIAWDKPEHLVPHSLLRGVTERVDYKGAEIVALNMREVEAAVGSLVAQGAEAIAISFLWSFMNPQHERVVKDFIARTTPDIFVTLSSDVSPYLGEYERTTTTLINAYLGPRASRDFASLSQAFAARGFAHPPFIMQSTGGVVWAEEAANNAVCTLSSGPVGGIIGCAVLGKTLGYQNIIATDMGGTSFDVGLVRQGEVPLARSPIYDRFRVLIPTVDVVSVGAGGGSIARIEPETGALSVGPQSAGSQPGPACYGWGGLEPTVTDADVVLGRIDPDNFFGGRKRLDGARAEEAVREKIAGPLRMDTIRAAKGIVDIVDAHMADLIRKATIERGYDPRDFVLLAYGGAGPLHVGAYARELGIKKAIVSAYAPVFSALGILSSDIVRFYAKSEPLRMPVTAAKLNSVFDGLARSARQDLERTGAPGSVSFSRSIDMRFRYQTHQLAVPVPDRELTTEAVEQLPNQFVARYEETFGPGTAFKEAGIELVTFRMVCRVALPRPSLREYEPKGPDASAALIGRRSVFFEDMVTTPVYDMAKLAAGNVVEGPAVVEGAATVVLVHPGQRAEVDRYLNVALEVR